MKLNITSHLRMIWAITVKDILDAIKNKTILGIMVGIAFLILSSQALPLLLRGYAKPRAYYFDVGKSSAIEGFARNRGFDFIRNGSIDELFDAVSSYPTPVLGLVFPSDFDERLSRDQEITLQGYFIHWAHQKEIAQSITYFEDVLGSLTGRRIRIQKVSETLYPDSESLGFIMMVAIGLVLGVMIIGVILVPQLLIEEKESHTIDALLITPVKLSHLLVGKSLVGMLYCSVAALVMFAFTWRWIVHWHIAVLAVFLGALAAVAVGLLLGSTSDNPTIINLWASLIIILFVIPGSLWPGIATKLAPGVKALVQLFPSMAMAKIIIISLTEHILFKEVFFNASLLLAFSILIFGVISWRIRQIGR